MITNTNKPYIENVSMLDIRTGMHQSYGDNTTLIQILDPGTDVPEPKRSFKSKYLFKFLDVEYEDNPFAISDIHAKAIANILQESLENNTNVVAHCHAGIYRSGAVVEVGVLIGFEDVGRYRFPNLLVMKKLLKELNLE